MTLFVLVACAVYDHGIYGVFTDKEGAVAHAEVLIDASDWHHSFRVEEVTVDEPRKADHTLIGWTGTKRGKRPGIEVVGIGEETL